MCWEGCVERERAPRLSPKDPLSAAACGLSLGLRGLVVPGFWDLVFTCRGLGFLGFREFRGLGFREVEGVRL